jgi:hypothetical protein
MAKSRVHRHGRTHSRKSHRAVTKKNFGKCANPVSTYGFQRWYTAMFEQLGLMVIAKSKGDMGDRIYSYKKSLERLINKLECKIDSVEEHDRKVDLQLMCENVKILYAHAHKYL